MADAQAYHRRKKRYRLASLLLQTALFLVLALTRGEPFLAAANSLSSPDIGQRAAFLVFFYLFLQVVFWPLRYLSSWRLEKDFGMSKQNFSGWFADYLKAQVLGLVFFVGSALVFFAALRVWPEDWWWVLAGTAFPFSAFFSTVFPVLILPLFYCCPPLNNITLIERLQETLVRCGLPKLPLFEIRMGEKTVRANAMLAGFGKTRRALLSDTLLSQYSPDEISMVLAHEAGHDVHRHLLRSLVFEVVTAGAAFYLLFRFSAGADLSDPALFPAIMLAAHLGGLLIMPATHALSRFHEKEADRFALKHYPDLAIFSSLMEKLASHNLADPSPGKIEEFFFYTHPSKAKRIAHAEKFLGNLLANSRRAD